MCTGASLTIERGCKIELMHPSAQIPQVPVDILVLAAYAPEFVGLRAHIGDSLHGSLAGLFVVAKTIGVGMAVAGGATATRIHQLSPKAVVVLGSCGIYPSAAAYRPLDVVIPSHLHLFDPSVAAGKAAFPEPMQTVLEPDAALSAGLLQSGEGRCRTAPVATTMAITTDDAIARAVHPATGLEGENLELFPVGLACRAADVPFAAVLGVTNMVGSTGRTDWRQYQRDAAIAAAEVLVNWLRRGAPGFNGRS
jgi:nucleoside phosphorylase